MDKKIVQKKRVDHDYLGGFDSFEFRIANKIITYDTSSNRPANQLFTLFFVSIRFFLFLFSRRSDLYDSFGFIYFVAIFILTSQFLSV